MSIIAIISDLGTRDYFVGAMKGVILSINPRVTIVDITHEIPKHDVLRGAFTLAQAAETFPSGTIFVGVVDPGVGTERRCILLRTRNDLFFVGPDNGLFTFVAERFGVGEVREIANKALMGAEISPTFHGRDIFAPVAAHLSSGVSASEVGPPLHEIKRLELSAPKREGERLVGEVLAIDDFGNILTNIGHELFAGFARLGDMLTIKLGDKLFAAKFARTFGDVREGELLCYIGSAGLLEVAKNMGNLAKEAKAATSLEISIEKRS